MDDDQPEHVRADERRVTDDDSSVVDGIDDEDGHPDSDDVHLEAMFSVVSERRRRLVLGYLSEHPAGTADLSEVAAYVHERTAPSEGGSDLDSIELSLYHRHLPKLEETGVIEFDQANGTIEYHGSDRFERFVSATLGERTAP